MGEIKLTKHTWFECGLCGPAVRCGTCGNNCCNGGSGMVDGHACPDCDDAYAFQAKGPPSTTQEPGE